MIVPTSTLPSGNPGLLTQDNQEKPSTANLLMAAAEMHRMGRLSAGPNSGPKAGPKQQMAGAENTPEEFEAAVRKNGEVRVDPNWAPMKKFLKNLPDDIEMIDKGDDVGRKPGETIRLKLRKPALIS